MILADTSVWVRHLRGQDSAFEALLDVQEIVSHPFVVGELLCGNLRPDSPVLKRIRQIESLPKATEEEVIGLIRFRRLMGRGVGYLDVHLVASVLITGATSLWSLDNRLAAVADELGIRFEP